MTHPTAAGRARPASQTGAKPLRRTILATSACAALALGAQTAEAQHSFVGTAAIPSGFGLYGNTLGLSVSGTFGQWRGGAGSDRLDASAALSFGIGDPVNALGLQADLNVTSFRNFGVSGYLSLTLHRMFQTSSAGVYSVALSASHLAPWGNSARVDPGVSLVGSYMFGLNGRLAMATLGVANNLNNARDVEGIFGFGVAVSDDWAVNLGWAGNQSVFGATWRPQALGGAALSISVRGIEDRNRRLIGFDLSRSFSLTGY